jgi:intracellular sulfur oxidation DsrE/DsrF family protein
MKKNNLTSRRDFMGTLAASATAGLAITAISNPLLASIPKSEPSLEPGIEEADAWFNKVKGKHRVVFDATRPHEIMPFVWPRIFLMTNGSTGTLEKDCGVVVVLRHEAIPYAFEDRLWAAYKFGEVFKAEDPATKAPSVRNPFLNTKPGDFKVPGFGEVPIGIKELQASGVMFCVCDAAMTVYSAAVAGGMQKDPAEVKKDWMSGLIPGIQVVPSGVWALGRAQEHQCAYIFAG